MARWFTGLWRHQDFLKLWGGQTFSMFGSMVSRLALPFMVIYTLKASDAQYAWVQAAEIAPGMLVGLLAGVWIDRLRRRPIMLWADAGRALLIGSIPVAFWLGRLSLTQVYLVAALVSILSVSFDVSYEAYIPTLVEGEHVVEANSKLQATASVAELTGFGIAGALFQLIGGAFTMAIDAFSFVISAVTLAWIRKPEPAPAPVSDGERQESVLREATEGLKLIRANRVLLTLSGVGGISAFYHGIMNTIYMLFVSRELQVAPAVQGVLYAFGGVSSFFGAALAQRMVRRFGLGPTLVGSLAIAIAGILLLPLAFGPAWLIVCFMVGQQLLGDGADTMHEIQVTSLRQTITPNAYLGRVNATWRVFGYLCVLVGTLAGGILAEGIGLRTTLFLAIGVRVLGAIWLLLSPVRGLTGMPEPDALATAPE